MSATITAPFSAAQPQRAAVRSAGAKSSLQQDGLQQAESVQSTAEIASRKPQLSAPAAQRARPQRRGLVAARGAGQDAVGSWIDLASFVSSAGGSGRTPFDELADKIGKDVYIDVAGWHLYLKDVKVAQGLSLAQALAGKLGPMIQGGGFREADLQAVLEKVPIKLGAGKKTERLYDLLPAACCRDFERVCEDYARDL